MRRLVLILGALMVLSACAPSSHGPWLDSSGEMVSNASILEYEGFNRCDTRDVVFFQFFSRQFAKDTKNALGELVSPVDGSVLTYDVSNVIPDGAEASGFRHRDREIWFDTDTLDDYLYIVHDDGTVERWPRAEQRCT